MPAVPALSLDGGATAAPAKEKQLDGADVKKALWQRRKEKLKLYRKQKKNAASRVEREAAAGLWW